MTLDEAIQIMTNEIATVLADNKPKVYLLQRQRNLDTQKSIKRPG